MAVPPARPTPQLCICDDATFLPWLTWPDVASLPDKEKIIVIVPIAGFANWGAELPLDAEEQVLTRVLKAAAGVLRQTSEAAACGRDKDDSYVFPEADRSERSGSADALSSESARAVAISETEPFAGAHSYESQPEQIEKSSCERERVVRTPVEVLTRTLKTTQTLTLTIPPLRFIAAGGPDSECAFAVEVPVALSFIDEVCASLAASGFSRVVLCNASPWNEELCDAAARDIRIERGLQMFCVNLSALGLDFNFARGGEADRARIVSILVDGTDAKPFGESVSAAGAHMAALLTEIATRAPLKNNGLLMAVSAPTFTPASMPASSPKQEGSP